jgi:hypothetical protein
MPPRREPGMEKPVRRKFRGAVRHVFASEDPQGKHFPGSQFGVKSRKEVLPHGLRQVVYVTLLHAIMNFHTYRMHENPPSLRSFPSCDKYHIHGKNSTQLSSPFFTIPRGILPEISSEGRKRVL